MEEVCRLPGSTFPRLVEYAISLLRCPQEAAQKPIVLFFGLALSFRPVLTAFDAEDGDGAKNGGGLYCLLNLLRTATMTGPSASTPTPQRRGQLAHYTTLALRHHLRVHLTLFAASVDADAPLPSGTKRPRLNSQDLTVSVFTKVVYMIKRACPSLRLLLLSTLLSNRHLRLSPLRIFDPLRWMMV